MIKNILTLVSVAVVLCTSIGVTYGQGQGSSPLSLKQYQSRVVDYSNSLKIADDEIMASKAKIKAARSGYFPALSLGASGNYMVGMPKMMGFELKDYTYNATLTLQQNVYTGGAVRNQTKAAQIEGQMAELGQQTTLDNVIYSAQVTYWAFAASCEQLEIAREYVNIVSALYDVVNERFRDGYVSKTDLLMVETRLNEARIQQTTAEKLYMSSLQNLNTRLGNDQIEVFAATDSIFVLDTISYSATLEDALQRRPDYAFANRNVDLQNQLVKLSRAKFNPQLVFGLQGVYGTPQINISGTGNFYGVAYAQLNIPILTWGERRNTVAQARIAARSAQWSLLDAKDAVNNELANAQIGLSQSFQQAKIAVSNLMISQDNLELNTYSYSEGRLPILDVLQAQLSWIQAYTTSVNSCYNYHISIADYDKALGLIGR